MILTGATRMRATEAHMREIGPRAYAAGIAENATPWMLTGIWQAWQEAFHRQAEQKR